VAIEVRSGCASRFENSRLLPIYSFCFDKKAAELECGFRGDGSKTWGVCGGSTAYKPRVPVMVTLSMTAVVRALVLCEQTARPILTEAGITMVCDPIRVQVTPSAE